MHEKKRDEDCRDSDRDEPFIADVTRWTKGQAFAGELVVKLVDEWIDRCAFEAQTKA